MTPLDPFEERLSATPRRELPPELRARVLAAAEECAPRDWRKALAACLWPHPIAWGAVAAAWVAVAALNFSGPRGEALYAVTPREYRDRLPSAQEYLARMDAERRLIALLAADRSQELANVRRPRYYLPRPQDL